LIQIKSDCDIYIDTLLCFIHSKASLEIESFKGDTVLTAYIKFLLDIVKDLYERVTGVGRYDESFYKYLAFEKPNELDSYLTLKNGNESTDDFLLRVLKNENSTDHFDQNHRNIKQIIIQYENFDHNQLSMASTLRDIMYKIQSIDEMLSLLKDGNVKWDNSDEAVKALIGFLDERKDVSSGNM
jgi:hypothetical protein